MRTLMSPSHKHPQFSHSSPKLLILRHYPQAYTLWVSHRVLYSSYCLCTIRHSCLSISISPSYPHIVTHSFSPTLAPPWPWPHPPWPCLTHPHPCLTLPLALILPSSLPLSALVFAFFAFILTALAFTLTLSSPTLAFTLTSPSPHSPSSSPSPCSHPLSSPQHVTQVDRLVSRIKG